MSSGSTCSVDGCPKPARSSRMPLCEMHYYRVRRNGYTGLKPRDEYREPARKRRYAKAPHTCTVAGCSIAAISLADGKQVCSMHYKRWERTGSFSLDVARMAREADHRALVAKMTRLYEAGMSTTEVGAEVGRDPSRVSRVLRDAGVQMRPRKRARTSEITYSAAHMRVRSDRGSAGNHTCACGEPAAQWSYTHNDPNEMHSREGAYSADPAYYIALCVPCHKRTDLARIREGR